MLERLITRTVEHVRDIQMVESILDEVRTNPSTNAKKAILSANKNNETLKKVLEYTYNPHKKYGVNNIEKIYDIMPCDAPAFGCEIWNLLDTLAENNINDDLRQELRDYLGYFEDIAGTLEGIVTKDLRLGVNASTINKIWKGLIPTSETGIDIKPMLASKFDFDKPPKAPYYASEKLDGIRCVAICKEDGIELYTRQGKLIEGCRAIENDLMRIRSFMGEDIVLDGELLADDCDYETVYKETTKRVKNKNAIKTDIHYVAFDILRYEEFENKKGVYYYHERLNTLRMIDSHFRQNCEHGIHHVEIIQPMLIEHETDLVALLDLYRNKGAEGLMVNLIDATYEFKRSKNILKVKVMQTADLKIIGFEEGTGRNAGRLGALLVDFKGNKVGVGSGFTDFDREYIWKNQDQYLGKICEVQYFETTKDKNGIESLRFPVYKHMRSDKTEPSLF